RGATSSRTSCPLWRRPRLSLSRSGLSALAIDGIHEARWDCECVPSMAHAFEDGVEGGRMAGDRSILRDVATAAGVSLRTASRVLNDDPRVAAVTRERVQRMMQDLQYTPDLMARSLRGGTDAT